MAFSLAFLYDLRMRKFIATIAIVSTTATATPILTLAADAPYIPVGTAKTKKTVIAFPEIKVGGGLNSVAKTVNETVTNDLAFMDLFKFLPATAFVEPATAGVTPDKFKMTDWSSIGAEFVIKSQVIQDGANFA